MHRDGVGQFVDVTADDSTVFREFVPPVDTGGKLPELDALGTISECDERLEELQGELVALFIITGVFFGMIAFATAYCAWRLILR